MPAISPIGSSSQVELRRGWLLIVWLEPSGWIARFRSSPPPSGTHASTSQRRCVPFPTACISMLATMPVCLACGFVISAIFIPIRREKE